MIMYGIRRVVVAVAALLIALTATGCVSLMWWLADTLGCPK